MDAEADGWKGPPSGANRITLLKNRLKEGGGDASDVRNGEALAARVAGEVGMSVPRTREGGSTLTATLYYLPPDAAPLNAFEQAISNHNAVFVSRLVGDRSS